MTLREALKTVPSGATARLLEEAQVELHRGRGVLGRRVGALLNDAAEVPLGQLAQRSAPAVRLAVHPG